MRLLSTLAIGLLLSGCATHLAANYDANRQRDMALDEMRTELGDIKHLLNSYKVEISLLQEKLSQQDSPKEKNKSDRLSEQLALLERRLSGLEKTQEKAIADLRQIHASVSQNKEKLIEVDARLDEVAKLKTTLSAISQSIRGGSDASSKSYTIKPGDSLEKIARHHQTTVSNLKKINGLTDDRIVVGQEIKLP